MKTLRQYSVLNYPRASHNCQKHDTCSLYPDIWVGISQWNLFQRHDCWSFSCRVPHIRDEKIIKKIYLKVVRLSTSGTFSRSALVCKYYRNQIVRKSSYCVEIHSLRYSA